LLYRLFLILLYPILSHPTVKSSSPTASMSEHRNVSEESLLKNSKSSPDAQQPPQKEYRYTTPHPPQGSTISKTGDLRKKWKVQPGYSSGASSYSGSDAGSLDDEDGGFNLSTRPLELSRHSDILDLSTMRQEMMAEGDLTKTVVRIEVRNRNRHTMYMVSGSGASNSQCTHTFVSLCFITLLPHTHYIAITIAVISDSIWQTD
jgi:hypothetical protein